MNFHEPEKELVEIVEKLKEYTIEMLKGNPEPYLSLIDPQIVMVGANGTFKSGQKAFDDTYKVSKTFPQVGEVTFTNQELRQDRDYASLLWNNSQCLKLPDTGKFVTMYFSVTHIFRKFDTGWRIVHFHNGLLKMEENL